MGIQIQRSADIVEQFTNGLSRFEMLPGAYPEVQTYKCTLKAGAKWEPELYSFEDKIQIFFFAKGTGYIGTPKCAYNITEYAVFVPYFDNEPFFLQAGTDLEFLHIVGKMDEYDKKHMNEYRITLPRFRTMSDSWTYFEPFKGPGVKAVMLLEHRALGRYSMGATLGKGPTFNGDHVHHDLEQWYYALPGSRFSYTADGEQIDVSGGDFTYITEGVYHASNAAEGDTFDYIWFELASKGYK